MPKMYLHPNSTVEDGAGGNPYTAIDDGVVEPTTPSASPFASETVQNVDKNDKNETQSYGTQDTTAVEDGVIDYVRLWLYRHSVATTGDEYIDYDLRIGGTWKGAPQGTGHEDSWRYWEWNTTVDDIELDEVLEGIRFRFVSPGLANGDNTEAYSGAYLEIDYSTGSPGGGGGSQRSAFLLFVD